MHARGHLGPRVQIGGCRGLLGTQVWLRLKRNPDRGQPRPPGPSCTTHIPSSTHGTTLSSNTAKLNHFRSIKHRLSILNHITYTRNIKHTLASTHTGNPNILEACHGTQLVNSNGIVGLCGWVNPLELKFLEKVFTEQSKLNPWCDTFLIFATDNSFANFSPP